MRNNLLFFSNYDFDGGSQFIWPLEPQLPHGFGVHLWSQVGSFIQNSLHHSSHLHILGSSAIHEAFSCMSKLVGAMIFWFSTGSNSNFLRKASGNMHASKPTRGQSFRHVKHISSCGQDLAGMDFHSGARPECGAAVFFGRLASSSVQRLWKEFEQLHSFPLLSLSAALVPPFDNISRKMLAASLESTDERILGSVEQAPCRDDPRGCSGLCLSDIGWRIDAIEPRTGIKFPTVLDREDHSSVTPEVLVGTGSRSMRVIKVKSLKVYAFGLYIHPYSLCEKLGRKYASVPDNELMNCPDFYEDLLRENIDMTVRLVVNCNRVKVSTVRDAFEKSLRARLQKVNPNTDYHCLSVFRSYFTQDIPLPVGTTIDFRQTTDGQLITEIGGQQMGMVHSKDLCRAFFDMYIGDIPVSPQAKHEIARNVGSIIKRC
ncbi:Fatty-acid-binding protein 2 [Acorus calamus]|uniref:Chalcone--flavanone isomerase n=1 Tax=Acorus calamus TaxID=4465 RepID=A0AAV9CJ66_ACOCL|nr:Fatty-acid-binding protein 2 [Acorus calamus]